MRSGPQGLVPTAQVVADRSRKTIKHIKNSSLYAAPRARKGGAARRRVNPPPGHSDSDCGPRRAFLGTKPEHKSKVESDGMVRIDKMYFTLKEVARAMGRAQMRHRLHGREWGAAGLDPPGGSVASSAACSRSKIRAGILGSRTIGSGSAGSLDLRRCDAFRVFRDGQAEIVQFEADDDEYAAVIEPTPSIVVLRRHLVVRKCERDRVEALLRAPATPSPRVSDSSTRPTTDTSDSVRSS